MKKNGKQYYLNYINKFGYLTTKEFSNMENLKTHVIMHNLSDHNCSIIVGTKITLKEEGLYGGKEE